jgi:peptidoglycan/LPS O-acetylase OafA/YrhL
MNPLATRNNNIGFIRLLAASMVIVSHSAEMIDGNRSRELLTRLFGTLSFGGVGVDLFFLISGYLITKSYLSSGNGYYLIKRVNRIYPGFLVAFIICIFVVAPLAGIKLSSVSPADWGDTLYRAFRLGAPSLSGAFANQPYHLLNGSMWTISCEFRCYLFVMLIGVLGIYKRRSLFLALPVVFLCLYDFAFDDPQLPSGLNLMKQLVVGDLDSFFRFMFVFTCGASFYLFEDKIKYTGTAALVSTAMLVMCMFNAKLAEPALCTFGAYCLFYLAFKTKHVNINNSYDISYGVYLYAWPIAALTILYYPAITPVYLFCFTLVMSLIAGTISWFAIEKPASSLLRHLPEKIKTKPVLSPMPESATTPANVS